MSHESILAGKRILVVEDEMLAALELADILESRDCFVVGPAGTLIDALPLAQADGYDIAILDITLRDGEVFPLAEWLKENGKPFIFATAYGSSAGLPDGFSGSVLIPKPYPERQLVQALCGVADQARQSA